MPTMGKLTARSLSTGASTDAAAGPSAGDWTFCFKLVFVLLLIWVSLLAAPLLCMRSMGKYLEQVNLRIAGLPAPAHCDLSS
jgi:hypothetical protein